MEAEFACKKKVSRILFLSVLSFRATICATENLLVYLSTRILIIIIIIALFKVGVQT